MNVPIVMLVGVAVVLGCYRAARHMLGRRPTIVTAALVYGGATLVIFTCATAAFADPDPNPGTVNPQTGHEMACWKHDPPTPSEHGQMNADGTAWVLAPFGNWAPWTHYELLVVKGGPNGAATYSHPTPGVAYFTPGLNEAGNHYGVSHVWVCKGKDAQTDTTVPVETTVVIETTIPETTVVQDTTTTAEVPTTSEAPSSTPAPTTIPPGSSVPAPTATVPPAGESVCDDTGSGEVCVAVLDQDVTASTLPATGRASRTLLLYGAISAAIGGLVLRIARRRPATN